MSVIDRRTLDHLAAVAGPGPLVSLYLPTHRAGRDVRQGPIRLKNLLRSASRDLVAAGLDATAIDTLLAPASVLVDQSSFWERQRDGLALFLEPARLHQFRCPRQFDEFCYVHDHFHLKPLLPLLRRETSFHLLALSLNDVRLYEVTDEALAALDLDGVPASLADALGHDLQDQSLQHHAGGRAGGARDGTVFHGQGVGEDDREQEVTRFLQKVDSALEKRLPPNGTPLVLAAVEEWLALYRKVTGRPDVIDGGIKGSPDSLSPDQMHAAAWGLARPVLERDADRAAAAFVELRGTDRAASRLEEIGLAVATGRVETLLVAADRTMWGRVGDDGVIDVHHERQDGDVDILDRLAMMGLRNGSNVVARRASRLPDGVAAAAVLRY